jgi:hypothetical protein
MISGKSIVNDRTIELYDKLNKFDTVICFGVSYKITENFHAGLRLNFGVLKIIDAMENCNGVGQLGISYKF